MIDGDRVRISGARPVAFEVTREIKTRLQLPRVSLRAEVDEDLDQLSERHVSLALAHAWELAVPEHVEDPKPGRVAERAEHEVDGLGLHMHVGEYIEPGLGSPPAGRHGAGAGGPGGLRSGARGPSVVGGVTCGFSTSKERPRPSWR